MTAADFTRDQLRHFNALAGSSQMAEFIANMRLVETFGNHAIAMRPMWSRIDALQDKMDARTITASEAIELMQLERSA